MSNAQADQRQLAALILERYASIRTLSEDVHWHAKKVDTIATLAWGAESLGNFPGMIPRERIVGRLDALLARTDSKRAVDDSLAYTRDYASFMDWEKHMKFQPEANNLFVNLLKVEPSYEGHKLGHALLSKLEENVRPDKAFLFCHPFGATSLQRTKLMGLAKLEAYYEALGFAVLARDKDGFALMGKNYT